LTLGEIVGTPVFIGNKTLAERRVMKGQIERSDRSEPTATEFIRAGRPKAADAV